MKKVTLIGILMAISPVGASAQQMEVISLPQFGVEATAPAGAELYTFARVYSISGAQLDVRAKAGNWLLEQWIEVGTKLVPVSTRTKFKACVPWPNTFEPNGPCFLDDDGDGKFDRHAGDDTSAARKLKQPVPYTLTPIAVARSDSLKRAFLFQGATADTLRFSYREFSNNIARPAFTEELVTEREPFPSIIRLKNLHIEVLGVSGLGLRYRVIGYDEN